MRLLPRIRSLPVRAKIALTVAGAFVVLLGAATWLSFSYWGSEALVTARQQARLAALQTRSTTEAALQVSAEGVLRRHLFEVMEDGTLAAVRIRRSDGAIAYSTDPAEEGTGAGLAWIPAAADLPAEGVVREDDAAGVVRVLMPLNTPGVALLEAVVDVRPIRTAMRRGALMGVGLSAASLVALAFILSAMLEREVILPLARVERELARETGMEEDGRDEVRGIRRSMNSLLERERAVEQQMRDQAGLAQVGQLASEMAHEFKRPLASLHSALDLLDREYQLEDGGRAVMSSVQQQLSTLRETMEDLFSLARPVDVPIAPVSLTEVLDDALVEFAGYPGAAEVEVIRDYQADPEVPGDARRLRQAFTNLMINALEAMPGGGRLTITASLTTMGNARLSFRDTGQGIPEARLDRIFLPFHSTKPQGTGLGLPLVARVVQAHGGGISVRSRVGEGTTFQLWLPTAEGSPEPTETVEERDTCPQNEFSSSTTTV